MEYGCWRDWKRIAVALLALAAWSAAPAFAQTTNSIDAVSVARASSGRTVVKFTLGAVGDPPAGFAINDPPRIALDFRIPPTVSAGRRMSAIPRCAA
jgi:type IV pilus assembly protein PilQ